MVGVDVACAVEGGRRASRDVGAGAILKRDRPAFGQRQRLQSLLELTGFERAEQQPCRLAFAQHRYGDGDQGNVRHWSEDDVADLRPAGLDRRRCGASPLGERQERQCHAIGLARVEQHAALVVGEDDVGTKACQEGLGFAIQVRPLLRIVYQRRDGEDTERPQACVDKMVVGCREIACERAGLAQMPRLQLLKLLPGQADRE